MTPQDLKTEITTDPNALGFAKFVGADGSIVAPNYAAAISDLLNASTGSGSGTVTLSSLSRNDFLLKIAAPAIAGMMALSDEGSRSTWQQYLGMATSATLIDLTDPLIQSLLAKLVADGLVTQETIDTATKRTGSRAEVLWGAGTIVQSADVMTAIAGSTGWTATVLAITTDGGNCVASVRFSNGQINDTQKIWGDDLTAAAVSQWAANVMASRANRDAARANLQTLVGTNL